VEEERCAEKEKLESGPRNEGSGGQIKDNIKSSFFSVEKGKEKWGMSGRKGSKWWGGDKRCADAGGSESKVSIPTVKYRSPPEKRRRGRRREDLCLGKRIKVFGGILPQMQFIIRLHGPREKREKKEGEEKEIDYFVEGDKDRGRQKDECGIRHGLVFLDSVLDVLVPKGGGGGKRLKT